MKKGLFVAGMFALLLGFQSCKECKTCQIETIQLVFNNSSIDTIAIDPMEEEKCGNSLENIEALSNGTVIDTADNGVVTIRTYVCE